MRWGEEEAEVLGGELGFGGIVADVSGDAAEVRIVAYDAVEGLGLPKGSLAADPLVDLARGETLP